MDQKKYYFLLGKIEMVGKIECLTGLHIGASKDTVDIGGIDLIVIRDPITKEPIIPGSSLRGKMRSLLEKAKQKIPNRHSGQGVYIHVCDDFSQAANCPVCRIFGSTGGKEEGKDKKGSNFPSRFTVRDCFLTRDSKAVLEKLDTGMLYTEWKFENVLDRVTSAANPRQIERVPRGTVFEFKFVYDIEDLDTLEEDLKNIQLAVNLLKHDSLGGHGSRGYGEVNINFDKIVFYSIDELEKESPQGIFLKGLTDIEEIKKKLSTNSTTVKE